jgi:hypothetical protein
MYNMFVGNSGIKFPEFSKRGNFQHLEGKMANFLNEFRKNSKSYQSFTQFTKKLVSQNSCWKD